MNRITSDIELGYSPLERRIELDEVIIPFTIIKVPTTIRTYENPTIAVNITSFFNSSRFIPLGSPNATDIELLEKIEIEANKVYFWRFIKLEELKSAFGLQEQELVFTGDNNFANNDHLSKYFTYSAILVLENHWDENNLSYYMDIAANLGCNFYFDSGLSRTYSLVASQCEAIKEIGLTHRHYIFGAVNLPPLAPPPASSNASIPINDSYYNMFISAGYVAYKAKNRIMNIRDGHILRRDTNLKVDGLKALVPASTFYTMKLVSMYRDGNAYASILNKNLGYILDGVDFIYTMNMIDSMSQRAINPVYVRSNNLFCFMSDVTPGALSNPGTPLKKENASRLSIDISRELKHRLSYLIGTKKNENEIKEILQIIKEDIMNKVIRLYPISQSDLEIEYESINDNELRVDVLIRIPSTVEFINISSIIV